MTEKCSRCEVLDDLLETAHSKLCEARDEAAKADRETLSMKADRCHELAEAYRKDYEVICYFRNLARELGATPSQMLERN